MPHLSKRFSLGLVGALALACLAPASVRAASSPTDSERVLFAFDDRALPFQQGLKLSLVDSHLMAGKPSNVVMAPGPDGAPDSAGCYFYGSVVAVKDEFWMWYLGVAKDDAPAFEDHLRICLAKSKDGKHWVKPALDAVDYRGSRQNNLVALAGGEFVTGDPTLVCYEADEPDPARRFKMAYDSHKYKMGMAVAFSPDGVHWTESANNPCGPWFEPSGLVKWRGVYMVNGQSRGQWAAGGVGVRVLQTLVSYDFEHWAPTTALGFRRDAQFPRPVAVTGAEDGEQVHLGASVWNRGNVIVGFYGMWHGIPSNDRSLIGIDLGLIVSHDGLHYIEPIPDFRIVPAKENIYSWPRTPVLGPAAISQGQGFANVGDRTFFWYGSWNTPADGVRLASWERDRLGYLQPWMGPKDHPNLISEPISTGGKPMAISLNASGLNPLSTITVSLENERFQVLPGFGSEDCNGPVEAGLKQRITWGARNVINSEAPIRIRVDFGGVRPEDIKLYAIYLDPAG